MNDIISVVMISLVWYQALRIAGMSVQAAPVTPAIDEQDDQRERGRRDAARDRGARPATMAAESRNWPS